MFIAALFLKPKTVNNPDVFQCLWLGKMWSIQYHHCYKKKETINAHNNLDESSERKSQFQRVTYCMVQFIGYA